jgi:SanA protein
MANTRGRKLLLVLLLAADVVVAGVFAANILIIHAAKGKTYSDVRQIPRRRVGLVLGCPQRVSDGQLNLFFLARVTAAAELFRQGKVDYLLASGDGAANGDDDADDLKSALINQGVPADKIYVDDAGFRTLDSIVRAKAVYGLAKVTVVSQQFQGERAIFIAGHWKLDAIGFNAPEVNSFQTDLREQLARVKAILDIYLLRTQPRLLGTKTMSNGSLSVLHSD